MAKTTQSGVVRPSLLWFLLLDGGIVLLTLLVFSDDAYARVQDRLEGRLPSRHSLVGLLIGTVVIHTVEASAAGRVARRRGLSAGGWRTQTFVVGFPSLLALRRTRER
jgi:Transmembrane protein 254